MNQIRTVKEQALRDGNEDHVEQLISILDALTACVSSLHEWNHETLIHELLTIPIWKTCQVRPLPVSKMPSMQILFLSPSTEAIVLAVMLASVLMLCKYPDVCQAGLFLSCRRVSEQLCCGC